ncbi:MAG TPA: DUF3108 domain-containing protein [Pyrinomonadaceae bacterium]|nr:DUF3108 domain-containing protein [Pyrinomonadaceae bacterium]
MKLARFSILCLSFLLLALAPASALVGERAASDNSPFPFEPKEESVFEAEFTRSLLRGVNIATLRFTASRDAAPASSGKEGASTLRFTAEVQSKGLFPKIFSGLRFRQEVESIVDSQSFNVLRTVKLDEQGNRKRTSEAVFDLRQKRVTWTERNPNDLTSQPRVVTSEFSGTVQDIASVFYFVRTRQLVPGKNFELLVSDSGRVYRMPVRVGETKKIKSILGEVEAVRVEPELFGEDRLVRGKGQLTIWFTTDARHIPVRAQIKHDMGTLDITLKSLVQGKRD